MAYIFFFIVLSNSESTTMHLGRVYFDIMQNTMTRESEPVFRSVAERMNTEPNLLINLYGYNYGRIAPDFDESRRLAESVKTHLVDNFRIPADRIQIPGIPKALSSTISKDTKDQWVDIVVRQPDAILAWFENDVKVQPPTLRPNWLNPIPDYYLYHGYKVTTGRRSKAHILYPGKGMLRMDEDAMVVIHGLSLAQKEEPILQNLKLQDGSLTSLLDNVAVLDGQETKTEADIGIASQMEDTVVADKLEDLVVVYQQNADVTDLGREPMSQMSDDTIKFMETAPSILPAIPTLISPGMNETRYYPNEITFAWQPSGVLSHLQVAEDSLFERIAFDAYAASESLVTRLSENVYYWRVSGINADSLEGDYTDNWIFFVEVDTLAPELEIAIARRIQNDRLIVSGRTEIDADLLIDGQAIEKESDGSFSYELPHEPDNDHITARAVDPAGNATERVCRIPGRPAVVIRVNSGFCSTTNNTDDALENGFWYGFDFSKMLLPSVSVFTGAAFAMTGARDDDISTMSDIMMLQLGVRKNFYAGGISPFVYVQAGFVWSQPSVTRHAHPGIINYGDASFDPSMGGGIGAWIHLGRHWHFNIHADYMHIFIDENRSGSNGSLMKIGIGIQDRML